jgi:hypothetical protein
MEIQHIIGVGGFNVIFSTVYISTYGLLNSSQYRFQHIKVLHQEDEVENTSVLWESVWNRREI